MRKNFLPPLTRLAVAALVLVSAFSLQAADPSAPAITTAVTTAAADKAKGQPKRLTPTERRELFMQLNSRNPSPETLRAMSNRAPQKVVGGTNRVAERINKALK